MGAKSKCPKFWKTKQKISIKLLKQINQRGEKFVPDEKLTKEKTKNNLRNQLQLISISQGLERERECVEEYGKSEEEGDGIYSERPPWSQRKLEKVTLLATFLLYLLCQRLSVSIIIFLLCLTNRVIPNGPLLGLYCSLFFWTSAYVAYLTDFNRI